MKNATAVTTLENRAITGLIVAEVIGANPNGDPDTGGMPRLGTGMEGMISPVSVNRKVRDLVLDKENLIWKIVKEKLGLSDDGFDIYENPDLDKAEFKKFAKISKETDESLLYKRFWDARAIGITYLEDKKDKKNEGDKSVRFVRSGIVKTALGMSVSPVEPITMSFSCAKNLDEKKDQNMAPNAYKVIRHGVYTIPFTVSPAYAHRTFCSSQDVDLFLAVLPYIYSSQMSLIRPGAQAVNLLHIWVAQHKSLLFRNSNAILRALTPIKKENPSVSSVSLDEYDVPDSLPKELQKDLKSVRDLIQDPIAE